MRRWRRHTLTHFTGCRVPRPRLSSADAHGRGQTGSICFGSVRESWDSASRDSSDAHVLKSHGASTCRATIKESHLPWYGDSNASPRTCCRSCSRSDNTTGGRGGQHPLCGNLQCKVEAHWMMPWYPCTGDALYTCDRGRRARIGHGWGAGTGPFTPTPPPSLEIGWKVPHHGRQRRPKEILLDLVEGEKMGFRPMCLYSKC